ncbi:MAG: hypothetical protein HGA51_04185 [Demequinaceae bacterium]|nr:hypothetical protein [Demequinaceae bacterium]
MHHETPIVPEPVTPVEAVAEHPNIFDELFPPGSSQAMLRQQDPFVAVSHEEPAASDSGQVPTLLPPQEVPVRELSPVEEMRRLAEEAMIGIERAAKADEAAAAAAAAAEAEAMPEFSWATQGDANPVVSQAEANPTFDSVPHVPQTANNGPATPPGGLAPHQAGFDQLARPASGQFPMPGQQGQPASGQFPMPGQAESPQGWPPAPQGLAAPMGPAWNSQPVNPPSGNVADPNDFTPLSDVPKPDFSGLFQPGQQAAFPPATGGMNVSGFNPTDPSSTGQVPSIRRPDLPEVGGAKHFKWLHLAVIGALMFVLGVVIYNAAFAQ